MLEASSPSSVGNVKPDIEAPPDALTEDGRALKALLEESRAAQSASRSIIRWLAKYSAMSAGVLLARSREVWSMPALRSSFTQFLQL